jgi:SecD/SecF fusion protein
MSRNYLGRLILIIAVLIFSLYELYPPTGRNLVEVFRNRAASRDATYSNIVANAEALEKQRPDRTYGNLLEAIGTNDITRFFPFFPAKQELNPTTYILTRLQREAAGRIKLGLDLQGGTSFLLKMQTNRLENVNEIDTALVQAVEVLRRRVDRLGVAEPVIQPVGKDQILVQLPGLSQDAMQSAKITLQRAAFLEFRMVHPNSDELLKQGIVEPGHEVLKEERKLPNGTKQITSYLVKKKAERGLTGAYVKHAFMTRGNLGEPEITLTFNGQGADLFEQITRENVGQFMAIVLDREIYSAPRINEPIGGGNARISGQFTAEQAQELANVLENPLKAPLEFVEERTVDPSLGKDSIASGVTASIIAAVGTFVFMLVFYFGSGMVANLALALNVLLLMGAMCAINATLTMPGIAGIALTIGMAVDANVLIYERMREEIAAGKSIRGVIAAGYKKAFGTIFDSNLTTVIAAIILIKFGTGPVQGFGVTLTIGIAASLFTAFFVTRFIYDFLLSRGWIKTIRMLPLIPFRNIRFMNWGKTAWAVSILIMALGVGSVVVRGKKVLGVDFSGGESLTLTFSQRASEDQLRSALERARLGDVTISYQKSLSTGREMLNVVVPTGAGTNAQAVLKQAFPEAGFEIKGTDVVGATVGAEIQRTAFIAALLALFAILVYVAFRYEFSFAVASVVALIHDVLVTMGIYFLTGRQLTAPMVAAILTIIGYSINDKIVIMDRIREDLKLGVRGSFRELIDLALNQTLSRTIVTGGAVILATLSLLIFGGGVINDFAFTFLVGTISGTYSSLFIASPLVLWWHKGQRPSIGGSQVNIESAATAKAKA